jgi:hypothetical protein
MSTGLSKLLQQMAGTLHIEYNTEEAEAAVHDTIIPALGESENKTFDILSGSAKGPLVLDDVRIVQVVPALNLMRCSSFQGNIDWVDSFLWLVDDTYKTLSVEDQKKLATHFSNYVRLSKQFPKQFLTKMAKYPDVIAKFSLSDEPAVQKLFSGSDSLIPATLLTLFFGYSLHVFSLKGANFFEPVYKPVLPGQDKKPTIFMICAANGHYEPLFQLTTDEFSAEFSWDDTILCSVKDVCNQTVEPKYALPNGCESVPTGTTLDSLDDWITHFFSTRILDEEETIEDDSDSFPIPELATEVISELADGTERIEPLPRQVAIQEKIDESDWLTAKTVGDGTCMLHAFLQSTSEAYRKITHRGRYLVGQWFRQAILLPQYPVVDPKKYPDEARARKRVANLTAFLEQEDLQILIDLFQINVVVLTTSGNLLTFFKPMEGFQGKPYIFMVNNDESHYSSIFLGNQATFMLPEDEMRAEYPEIVEEMYKDAEYESVRREVVDFVRSTGAEEAEKDKVVQNIFRHIRPQEGQADPTGDDKPARLLEGTLNSYAERLGVPTTNFNQFRQRLRNTTQGGRRRMKKNSKSRKTLKARR